MSQPSLPLADDSTTVSSLVDFHLEHNSNLPFAVFPTKAYDGVSVVTFLEFGRATHRFVRHALNMASKGDVVSLIANTDTLLYITAVAGFMRAGMTVFPISPRNSPAAILHLMRKTSSHHLVVTFEHQQTLLAGIQDEITKAPDNYRLSYGELPSLQDLYPRFTHEQAEDSFNPVSAAPKEVFHDGVALYIHSSGSTGCPKPIPFTHQVIADERNMSLHTEVNDDPRELLLGAMSLPSFHAMGIFLQLFYPLFTGRPTAIFAPAYPRPPVVVSPDSTIQAMKQTNVNITIVVPSFLEAWAEDPATVAYLAQLCLVGYGGGSLASGVGDRLAQAGVLIGSIYGGTEFGTCTRLFPPQDCSPKEWPWLAIADRARPRWVPVGDEGFELQLLECETHKLSVHNISDTLGYATNDVFVPHPTKQGLWRIIGRVDDVIIMANGEKVVPGPMEGAITSHPLVAGAVMFGRERNQVGVLVEPVGEWSVDLDDEKGQNTFKDHIWSSVEAANRLAPEFGRLFHETIVVSNKNKPLPRTPKGTVSRKAALEVYKAEISSMYAAIEHGGADDLLASLPSEWTLEDVTTWLKTLCLAIRGTGKIDVDVDLFEQGFDSISVTRLRNQVIRVLQTSDDPAAHTALKAVNNKLMYANPTIKLLATALFHLGGADASLDVTPTQAVEDMIAKYPADMPSLSLEVLSSSKPTSTVVLITGSTGGLGSQLLSECLMDDNVTKVYVLNRPAKSTSVARHEATFGDRGLDKQLLASPKLVFLEGDAGNDLLGLDVNLFDELRNSVTTIIHNAWRLDFNLALASFESNIRGTRNLIDLALTSPHAAHIRFLFTSSIGTAQSWPAEQGLFPEEPMMDACWALGGGYGESKYVCERLLLKATQSGLQTTSFRIGQITGSQPNGAWATSDWLPILVKSSIALGCLPDALGTASWIPTDAVARTILDVAFSSDAPAPSLNVVHPHPITWTSLFHIFADALAIHGHQLPLVPWAEWQAMLEIKAATASEEDMKQIPAIKLQAFFASQAASDKVAREGGLKDREAAGLASLSTTKAQAASSTLRDLPPVDCEDVGRWVAYWRSKGFM